MPKRTVRGKSSGRKKGIFLFGETGKKFLERVLPVLIPFLFFGFFFFFLSKAAFSFLTRSAYFSIQTVEASSPSREFAFKDPHLMGSLLGRNIFQIDLPTLQNEVSEKHPELLSAFVSREFPNRIRIYVTPRIPVAALSGGADLLIDREGILLPSDQTLGGRLPLLVGISEKLEPSHIGRSLRSQSSLEALALIESLHRLPELSRYVQLIDVSDADNLSFKTPEGLEVRVGKGNYEEKLKLFDRTRVTLGDRLGEIKYIDLRFDEPVIGSR